MYGLRRRQAKPSTDFMRCLFQSAATLDLTGLPAPLCGRPLEHNSLMRRLKALARQNFSVKVESKPLGTTVFTAILLRGNVS